jgi:hypothetical protein
MFNPNQSGVKVPTWVLVHPGSPSGTCHEKAFIQKLAAYKLQQLLYPPCLNSDHKWPWYRTLTIST